MWGSPQAAPLSSILAPLPHTLQCRSWRSGRQSITGELPADLAKHPGGTQAALVGVPEALLHFPEVSEVTLLDGEETGAQLKNELALRSPTRRQRGARNMAGLELLCSSPSAPPQALAMAVLPMPSAEPKFS